VSEAEFRRKLRVLLARLRARTERVAEAIAGRRTIKNVLVRGHWVKKHYVKPHRQLRIA
jgi:hypothetical protein